MAIETVNTTTKTSVWTDPRYRSLITQAVVIGLLGAFVAFIISNTAHNLEQRGIATGFGFLSDPAGYDISISLIPYEVTDTHGRVFFIGLLNTLAVAIFGIIFSTIIGVLLGVLRLSGNWLVARLVSVYIEMLRNIPVLLQILFWYGIFLNMPRVRQSLNINDIFFINNRGINMPAPVFESGFVAVPIAFAVAVVGAIVLARWAHKRQEATGQIFPTLSAVIALVVGLPVLAFLATGAPLSWNYPELKGFNFQGGLSISPTFIALWLALTLYTAAFIAENVRSGIQAVSHGQTEAAYALGLRPNWTMRLVILPQALRVIIPPLTSQYLNLTKNSSLAIAVGYPDLVATFGGTTLNQTGQAIEVIAITMAVYLSLSLTISLIMNWYNKRIALVER